VINHRTLRLSAPTHKLQTLSLTNAFSSYIRPTIAICAAFALSSMATTTTQNCWLLAIPPELRLDVYELVFSQSAVGIAAFESDHEPWKFNTSRSYEGSYRGSLLSTCKTTFKEALPVSYKNTAFHILIYDGQFSYVPHFCILMCLPRPELIT
jgi:hypothetical protein